MVAFLIEAFGNNFNNGDKCNNCDNKLFHVKSCLSKTLRDDPSLCNNSLAQDTTYGTSQNCKYHNDIKYCLPEGYNTDGCSLGSPETISSNCKLNTTTGGNLTHPICTGINRGLNCKKNDKKTPEIPLKLRNMGDNMQNYGQNETGKNFFCEFDFIGGSIWKITNSGCEPK